MNHTSRLGAMLDFGFDSMGVSPGVLSQLGRGGGSLGVFFVTVGPIVHFSCMSPVDVYVTDGGGYFRQNLAFRGVTPIASTVSTSFFSYLGTSPLGNGALADASINKPGITRAEESL